MAQQINLINPALRKKRDLLTAIPLSIATGILLVLIVVAAFFAHQQADTVQAEADKRAAELKKSQERLAELGKVVAETKPDPKLAEELENARTLLNLREEIVTIVEGGALGKKGGFSEYMRGFTRQVPRDLWLTGFVLSPTGENMEIRGRMMNAAALPEFIRRLNSETIFQGVGFSSLLIDRPPPEPVVVKPVAAPVAPPPSASKTPGAPAVPGAAKPVVPPLVPVEPPAPKESPYVDFILRSKLKDGAAGDKK